MPRKPKQQQQQLVVPPGKDPSNYAGTQEAKDKMARVRAARGGHPVAEAAVAMQTGTPAANPMVTAVESLKSLREMATVLHSAGLGANLREPQVLGLLIKGLELGIGPVEAVQSLYVTDDGRIEAQAELMRALINRSGVGVIDVTTYSDTIVGVRAYRYGVGGRPDTMAEFHYSVDDAKRARLYDDKWERWPRAMCLARCTSEMARTMFPDVMLGASYAPGEVGGKGPVETAPTDVPIPQGQPMLPEQESGVVTPEESPQQAPQEPPTAPETPQQAQEPTPPAAEAPVASQALTPPPQAEAAKGQDAAADPFPAGNGEDQPTVPAMVHIFRKDKPEGGFEMVSTAGITKEQLQQIGDLTTNRAGQTHYKELQAAARGWLMPRQKPFLHLTARKVLELKYLTAAEGAELIRFLGTQPCLNPTLAPVTERSRMLDHVLAETATQHLREKVVLLITKSVGVDELEQVPVPELKHLLAQVRSMITDPQVFALTLEQVLSQAT